jgi:hypothetical protein
MRGSADSCGWFHIERHPSPLHYGLDGVFEGDSTVLG